MQQMIESTKNSHQNGYLEIIMGPMFSGKTTKLIEKYQEYQEKDKNVLAINFMLDKRYSNTMIASHDNKQIPCVFASRLDEIDINKHLIHTDIILINEGQFFPDLNDSVKYWVEDLYKTVYIAALDGDFQRKPFGDFLNILPLCDRFTKLRATCNMCNSKNAIFSHRISDEKEQVVIGSENKYVPLCRKCYLASCH